MKARMATEPRHRSGMVIAARSLQDVFDADLAKMNGSIQRAGALRTDPDGFQWVDATKLSPGFMSAYAGLQRLGYANGLIP